MELLTLLGIAVGLAMDALAVAVSTSIHLGRIHPRQVFRFSFHFGLFQAFMPLLGWLAGRQCLAWIQSWDHWAAFGLLTFIGLKAIREAWTDGEEGKGDPTRGWSLVFLSLATSIDALAVGLSFGLLDLAIWYPCAIIGLVTAGLTVLGMQLGQRIGLMLGRRLQVAGGLVLLAIGLKILLGDLLA